MGGDNSKEEKPKEVEDDMGILGDEPIENQPNQSMDAGMDQGMAATDISMDQKAAKDEGATPATAKNSKNKSYLGI